MVAACSSSDGTTTAGAVGGLTGTLYFEDENFRLDKVDLATGAFTQLGTAQYPQKLPSGNLLCVIDNNLADAPENLLTYRHVRDLKTGSDVFAEGITFPRISPDGSKVAYVTTSSNIVVVDFQSGELVKEITAKGANIGDPLGLGRPSWTPDGRLVFTGALTDFGIYITDAQLGNVTRIDQPQNLTDVSDAMVSHDGKFIAYLHAKHVWRMGIDASNPTQIDTTADETEVDDAAPFWSPDDRTIYWNGYAGDVYFHAAADGSGPPSKLFDLYPSVKDHILIVGAPGAMDWAK